MPKAKAKTKAKTKAKIEMPMVKPAARMERNLPKKPNVLRVCGSTIPVVNGKAQEADPKKLRAQRKAALRRRGLGEDEERI